MNMIGHSTCGDEPARMIPQDPANVLKQARLYVGLDLRLTVFCAEYDVAMERREGLWHGGSRA
jgi:hypothetical protein